MNQEEIANVAFEIILYAGNARTIIHEAFALMNEKDYVGAEEKLAAATEEINLAHGAQTSLLQKYAEGIEVKMEVILVHAQDHLMNTMTLQEVATEMMRMHQKIDQLSAEVAN